MNSIASSPRDASLLRIGATVIDLILAFFICLMSPFFFGPIWWICRFYFHIHSGTSVGKRILHIRLVDSKSFQHPTFFKCVLHDALGFALYLAFAITPTGYRTPIWDLLSTAILVLFILTFVGSLISAALDKSLSRTIYDLWSKTAVIRERDSDLFYPEHSQ
jgi:hypothetical protein